MDIRVLLSGIATIIAVVSFVPYIRSMLRGKTKPHAFSWLIWSVVAYIAGAGQLAAGGGVGAVAVLVTAAICTWVTIHAFRNRAVTVTKGDRISLAVALAAIPIWVVTKDPLPAVMLVTIIDLLAFWMTMRKTYHQPHSENLTQYTMSIAKYALIILAVEQYNLTTLFYPVVQEVATIIFCVMVVTRRQQVALPPV